MKIIHTLFSTAQQRDYVLVFCTWGTDNVWTSNLNTLTSRSRPVLYFQPNLPQKIQKKVYLTIVMHTYLWSSCKFALIIKHQGAANVSRTGSPVSLWSQNNRLASAWNRSYCSSEHGFWHFRSLKASRLFPKIEWNIFTIALLQSSSIRNSEKKIQT